jgi:hypothetical protein
MRFIAVASVLFSVLAGCASAGTSGSASGQPGAETLAQVTFRDREVKVSQHVGATVDDTWKVLGPAFQDLGYKGGPSGSGNERMYMTSWLRLPGSLYEGEANSAYFDCDPSPLGIPTADTYELTFAVFAWVAPDQPGGSIVRVLVNGSGRDRANPSAMVSCAGTGKLEAMFMQAIQRRLKLAAKPPE